MIQTQIEGHIRNTYFFIISPNIQDNISSIWNFSNHIETFWSIWNINKATADCSKKSCRWDKFLLLQKRKNYIRTCVTTLKYYLGKWIHKHINNEWEKSVWYKMWYVSISPCLMDCCWHLVCDSHFEISVK